MKTLRNLLFFSFLCILFHLSGTDAKDAFQWSYILHQAELTVTVSVKEHFYLYENATKVTLFSNGKELSPLKKPAAISYEDKIFGKIDVFRGASDFQWVFPIRQNEFPLTLKLSWQGCSEATGDSEPTCYFPEDRQYTLSESVPFDTPVPLMEKKVVASEAEAAEKSTDFPAFEILRTESGYMASDLFLSFLKGEKGAMFLEGNWNILAELQNYPDMVGKWDVAVLPACPDPVSGEGRATISNGLSYATGANNPHLDIVKDVLKFFGSEEGQRIQGESGAAIPAYEGLEDTWVGVFDEYPIDVQCFIDMFDYCIQSVNNAARPEWKTDVSDTLLKIYTGELDLDTGLAQMQEAVDTASAEYYEEDA